MEDLLAENLEVLCFLLASALHPLYHLSVCGGRESRTLLRQQKAISLLNSNTVSRVLVIRGKSRRVRRLGDLAVVDLLQGVNALAGCVEGVHEMHGCGLSSLLALRSRSWPASAAWCFHLSVIRSNGLAGWGRAAAQFGLMDKTYSLCRED